ncbi:hypothetical protein AAVH_16581 [Aphelenchoides avenae]|nr:hypothetical protein AAVH_16581 [Aphelenchus avenae]
MTSLLIPSIFLVLLLVTTVHARPRGAPLPDSSSEESAEGGIDGGLKREKIFWRTPIKVYGNVKCPGYIVPVDAYVELWDLDGHTPDSPKNDLMQKTKVDAYGKFLIDSSGYDWWGKPEPFLKIYGHCPASDADKIVKQAYTLPCDAKKVKVELVLDGKDFFKDVTC